MLTELRKCATHQVLLKSLPTANIVNIIEISATKSQRVYQGREREFC